MDPETKKVPRKPNPIKKANILAEITFAYMFPIFRRTFKKGLAEEDLFQPLDEHKSSILGEKLETIWRNEYGKDNKRYALHRALCRMFGPYFVFIGILRLINELMLVIVLPLSIGQLVAFFESNKQTTDANGAYLIGGGIVLCLLLESVISHPNMMALMHLTMKMRVACSALVYRKMLKLSSTSMANTTVGQLVNLLTNDVSRFDHGFLLANFVWVGPIQTAVAAYLIYRHIGVSAFFGVAFLISCIPLIIWLGKRTSVLRLRTALRTDERVRLMNEIISGIQVIKMYCWEKPFSKLIDVARRKEMQPIRGHGVLLGLIYSFDTFAIRLSIFISILGYVLLGNRITAEKLFAVTAIYNVIKTVIIILFSKSISSIAEVNISVLRIQKFLAFDERDIESKSGLRNKQIELNGKAPRLPHKPEIILENVTARWSQDSPDNTLKSINLKLVMNQIIAVIGPVGSGKSSLLNIMLQELPVESGKLNIDGTISYSSQEPWIFSASVKQNILFGGEYDEERYLRVVEVCALKSDFELFPYGDKTLVGERGTALSGGQKARINLARCIYKKADIYLLDDPLSAVDANVGKHLYENCIGKFLNNKIRIIITHQLQYLSNVDQIVMMKDGAIEMQGKYEELQTSGLDFANLLKKFNSDETKQEKEKVRSRQASENTESECDNADENPIAEKEQMFSGSVKSDLYKRFLSFGGGYLPTCFLIALFILSQIAANGGDYYVAYWVNEEQYFDKKVANNLTEENETLVREPMIYIYSAITLATIIFAVAHSLFCFLFFIIVSINIHHLSFTSIIKATMRFYHNNPSGRILNRFSKDLGYIDEYIPDLIFEMIDCGLILVGTLVLTVIVEPWLLVPSIVLIIVFYFFRIVYIKTSRSVKRIESITRSPIFSHMTASMLGLSTIRAFEAEEVLTREFDDYQDNHSAAWFLFLGAARCFGFWLDIICICFIAACLFLFLVIKNDIYGGDIGLIVTQYFGLIGTLQWGMRQWSELENNMVSVERLLEYQTVEQEPDRNRGDLPKNWPEQGEIIFDNVSLRYNPDDTPVLKNLTFTIQPKEKIGIVGRTGAGKSSTVTALFQLYPVEGRILIDGIDTTKVPLDEVRSKISIIPQDPVLFSGTMRKNLDPFEEYSDAILWNALEQVELKEVIEDLPAGLNCHVAEGGSNFSVGQRQLVCLARALVRNNKILVMDEATANVDPKTDALIQDTFRKNFADCTVLTIAHRLHTVMDSDKILVMNAGRVQEFDHPHKLLQKNGILYDLVQSTGNTSALSLENIARTSYEKKDE